MAQLLWTYKEHLNGPTRYMLPLMVLMIIVQTLIYGFVDVNSIELSWGQIGVNICSVIANSMFFWILFKLKSSQIYIQSSKTNEQDLLADLRTHKRYFIAAISFFIGVILAENLAQSIVVIVYENSHPSEQRKEQIEDKLFTILMLCLGIVYWTFMMFLYVYFWRMAVLYIDVLRQEKNFPYKSTKAIIFTVLLYLIVFQTYASIIVTSLGVAISYDVCSPAALSLFKMDYVNKFWYLIEISLLVWIIRFFCN